MYCDVFSFLDVAERVTHVATIGRLVFSCDAMRARPLGRPFGRSFLVGVVLLCVCIVVVVEASGLLWLPVEDLVVDIVLEWLVWRVPRRLASATA